MKLPLTERLRYLPASVVNEYEGCVEIPDAPSLLDYLPRWGIQRPRDPVEYPVPDVIKTPSFLLPHQVSIMRRIFWGGLLSDAPRMGKTVTALGWCHVQKHYHPEYKKVVIVCPAILKHQWREHVNRFSCDGLEYEIVSMDAPVFPSATDILIVDEARHVKHGTTSRYSKLEFMYRSVVLCLEATPISDKGSDLFGPLHLIRPDWFPSLEQFVRWYVLKVSRFEPLMDRLRDDTRDLWVWRTKRVNREKREHKFESEREAFDFVRTLPRPLVIFTDTRRRAESVAKKLGNAELLTGDYRLSDRQINVEKFQRGEIDCLVCTFWAAGEGIDLSTAKSTAVFGFDWTPATIEQAIARTDHIDPKRPKASVDVALWPGEPTRKRSVAAIKEFMLANDWAEDATEQLQWH